MSHCFSLTWIRAAALFLAGTATTAAVWSGGYVVLVEENWLGPFRVKPYYPMTQMLWAVSGMAPPSVLVGTTIAISSGAALLRKNAMTLALVSAMVLVGIAVAVFSSVTAAEIVTTIYYGARVSCHWEGVLGRYASWLDWTMCVVWSVIHVQALLWALRNLQRRGRIPLGGAKRIAVVMLVGVATMVLLHFPLSLFVSTDTGLGCLIPAMRDPCL